MRRRAAADGALLLGGTEYGSSFYANVSARRAKRASLSLRDLCDTMSRYGTRYSIKCGSAEYALNACDDADFICTKPADLKFYSKFCRKNENF